MLRITKVEPKLSKLTKFVKYVYEFEIRNKRNFCKMQYEYSSKMRFAYHFNQSADPHM